MKETRLPSRVVCSGASSVGCQAFISLNERPISQKNWGTIELEQSSTWKELVSVKHALQRFSQLLRDKGVKWLTGNQGVPVIVKSGSTKVHLNIPALDIFTLSRT